MGSCRHARPDGATKGEAGGGLGGRIASEVDSKGDDRARLTTPMAGEDNHREGRRRLDMWWWLRWGATVMAVVVILYHGMDAFRVWLTMPRGSARGVIIDALAVGAGMGGVNAALAIGLWVHEFLRHPRGAVAWQCRQCGYDRRGLEAGACCPECGAGPPAAMGR